MLTHSKSGAKIRKMLPELQLARPPVPAQRPPRACINNFNCDTSVFVHNIYFMYFGVTPHGECSKGIERRTAIMFILIAVPSCQCSGSMTFWGGSGSGSADPCPWLMDPDPGSGSCYFRHEPSRCQQKNNFIHNFFFLLLFEGTFTSFFKDKKSKRFTK